MLSLALPSFAQDAGAPPVRAKVDDYARARQTFDQELAAYWKAIADKRRLRIGKRRNGEAVQLDDYVLTQPPVYKGPPAPDPGSRGPTPPERRKVEIPVVADFLRAAEEQYQFVPRRPQTEAEFKRAYARSALDAGLTRDQIVRIYAFETGGNGTYDAQAGLVPPRPGARAISPAIGYNQLLSTNSVELMAEHGEEFVEALRRKTAGLSTEAKKIMDRKIEAVRRMIAFSRTVPDAWSEHDYLAKNTPGGMGIHGAILDLDLGPLLQTRKLVNSVLFARSKGYKGTLTAAELEMMNFTGDGNGLDMVLMPAAMRQRVPTANFFQQEGYERNPIARRTAVVAALFASIESKMDQAAQSQGARDLAAAFSGGL